MAQKVPSAIATPYGMWRPGALAVPSSNNRTRTAHRRTMLPSVSQTAPCHTSVTTACSAPTREMKAAAASAIEAFGQLDVVVNNAGISKDVLISSMQTEDWRSVMDVNFGGVFNGTKAVLEHFMSRGTGSIINMSSVMGERGWVGEANYSASKGAINAFTRCSAVELARFGIRVNAVMPGFVPTELVEELVAKSGAGIKRQLPMRRFGAVEQIAGVVSFLAGEDSAYMTGECLAVDGGAAAQLGLGRPK